MRHVRPAGDDHDAACNPSADRTGISRDTDDEVVVAVVVYISGCDRVPGDGAGAGAIDDRDIRGNGFQVDRLSR